MIEVFKTNVHADAKRRK